MTATVAEQALLTVPARAAAVAWLNAFSASGDTPERPILCKTLSLEFFDHRGLQLIGCDGTALFRTWVPADAAEWPDYAEVPNRQVVVIDGDGFGHAFMRTLLAATKDDEHTGEKLTLTIAPADEGATLALGEEFMTERLVLRSCGQRIDLKLFETTYPKWRRLRLGLEAIEHMESMTIAPRLCALVGRLRGVSAIDLEFYGDTKHIAFVARGEGEVRGLLMPMRKPEKPIEDVPRRTPPPDPAERVLDHLKENIEATADQMAERMPADTDFTISTGDRSATRRGRRKGAS